MNKVRTWKRSNRRRGIAAVTVMISTVVLFGMAALTVDVGLMFNTRAKLQNIADAAALSSVQAFNGADLDTAMILAEEIAASVIARNLIWNNERIQDYEIVFGQSRIGADPTSIAFDSTAVPPNAVQVTVHYNLTHAFSGIFGIRATTVKASATSSIGARDIMYVLDASCTMSALTETLDVAGDLGALGIPFVDSDSDSDENGNGDTDDSDADSDSDIGGEVKVKICHRPPGNPGNSFTIDIAAPAVPAHLAHGDTAGACLIDTPICGGLGGGNGDSDSDSDP